MICKLKFQQVNDHNGKTMKKKLLISFSGGRTSAFMTQWIIKNLSDEYEMIVVFANTGKERPETLDFVKRCDEYFNFNCVWIEAITNPKFGIGSRAKVVTYETASKNGEPFEQMIAKHGIPNVMNPNCTRELKRVALRAYCRSIGWKGYYTAIGYRIDEIDRMAPDWQKQNHIYPLISNIPTKKNGINKFWRDMPFDLNLKTYEGNCDICFKKSDRKIMTLLKENPYLSEWWLQMEEKYNTYIPIGRQKETLKPPINFFRQNRSLKVLIEMSKLEFNLAKDESQFVAFYEQLSLFDSDLDLSGGCSSESCEAF